MTKMAARTDSRALDVLMLALVLNGSGCGAAGAGGGAASADETEHQLLGAQAPAFELKAVAGQGAVSTSAYAGQVVIVDFWATWCAPCKDSFPFYEKLMEENAGKLMVLGVSVDEEPDAIAAFVAETGVHFPVGWDEGQGVAQMYKPPKMPTSYMVDKNGIVRFVHGGFKSGDEDAIRSELQSLL